MDKNTVDVLFTEILNRHQSFFMLLIRDKFEQDDAKDVFQDACLHLYQILETKFDGNEDLFNSKAWLRTVIKNFCLSELRKRNRKKSVKLIPEYQTTIIRQNYTETDISDGLASDLLDVNAIMTELLKLVSKQEALMLKMKYYYDKPSTYISQRLNIAHVNVSIGRIKERIIQKSGIKNFDELISKYNWSD